MSGDPWVGNREPSERHIGASASQYGHVAITGFDRQTTLTYRSTSMITTDGREAIPTDEPCRIQNEINS